MISPLKGPTSAERWTYAYAPTWPGPLLYRLRMGPATRAEPSGGRKAQPDEHRPRAGHPRKRRAGEPVDRQDRSPADLAHHPGPRLKSHLSVTYSQRLAMRGSTPPPEPWAPPGTTRPEALKQATANANSPRHTHSPDEAPRRPPPPYGPTGTNQTRSHHHTQDELVQVPGYEGLIRHRSSSLRGPCPRPSGTQARSNRVSRRHPPALPPPDRRGSSCYYS